MRIITGKFRGKQIKPPSSFKDRPTTDFAKESLFNIIINNYSIEEIKVLDLFAGTGSISYEFASRGCNDIVCVEISKKYCEFILKTKKELDINQLKIINADVFKFLKSDKNMYDIIFADPPYNLPNISDLPEIIIENRLIAENGIFILEHGKNISFKNHPNFIDERRYGAVHFSFFKNI